MRAGWPRGASVQLDLEREASFRPLGCREAAVTADRAQGAGAGSRNHGPVALRRLAVVGARALQDEASLLAVQRALDALDLDEAGGAIIAMRHQVLGRALTLDVALVGDADGGARQLR